MKLEELTPEIVTPVIEAIVAEYGEGYVYKKEEREEEAWPVKCRYQENGEPSCIVGHVLNRLGVEYDPRWDEGSQSAQDIIPEGAVQKALQAAQSRQDGGNPWGRALKAYKEALEYQV